MIRRSLAALAMLSILSCGHSPAASTLDVELFEFGIRPSSSTFAPGPVDITATNTGEFAHTIVITDASGRVVAASDLIPPGDRLALHVDLPPSEYQITCRIVATAGDGVLRDHFELGMAATISG